ncbi:hypothetical protein HYDPIDRAFT_36695 [Hydnomerulius pinastri MD-312]|nr:hypothetical protein HYDPIDRAFT_36695 [Hydnomerulius pinastri MD-312]
MYPPAMHRALKITDIQQIICDHLPVDPEDPVWSNQPDRPTLYALARTCRAWVEVALNRLWSYLSSYEPLLRCLPKDVWSPGDRWRLCRRLRSEEWDTFQKYARRVRCLRVVWIGVRSQRLFGALSHLPIPLLPNLQLLAIEDFGNAGPEWGNCWRPLLSSTITQVHISSDRDALFNSPRSILWALGESCPNIKEFDLNTNALGKEVTQSFLSTIQHWKHLATLTTYAADTQTMLHFSSLQSLTSLSVTIFAKSYSAWALPDANIIFPPTLKYVSLEVLGSFDLLALSLASVYLSVTTLEITIHGARSSSGDTGRLHKLLATNVSSDHLQSLTLFWRSEEDPDGLSLNVLRPLFQFRLLHTLYLVAHSPSDLDDAVMTELARSFPLLKDFSYRNNRVERPSITHRGLVSLLKSCPKLHGLSLAFDATGITTEMMKQYEDEEILNTQIGEINVCSSPITDPAPVALFLKAIMPGLRTVDSTYEYLQEWMTVSGMLSLLDLVTARERKRAERHTASI